MGFDGAWFHFEDDGDFVGGESFGVQQQGIR